MIDRFNIYAPILSPQTGFGYLAVKLIEALDAEGVQMSTLSPNPYVENREQLSQRLIDIVEPTLGIVQNYNTNLMINVPQYLRYFVGKKNVVFTMFESSIIPELHVRTINKMQQCIVPSTQNWEAFEESGVKIPISVVPFGNDQKDYFFQERDWDITESDKVGEGDEAEERGNPFTFLHIGEINWRKGGDLALKAFKKVFPPSVKDVRICFKFSLGYTPKFYLDNVKKVNDPRITLIKQSLSLEEMRSLYKWSHCFLGCSRGEGWGLLAWQALATGCPAIVTDWGGMAEYAHLAYPLDYTMEYSKSVFYGSEWGNYPEPSLDHLCEQMEFAYKNPGKIRDSGKNAAEVIARDYTWQHSARKLLSRMEDV